MTNEGVKQRTLEYDPKYIDLIRKLAGKTRDGKVTWRKDGRDLITDVGSRLRFVFTRKVMYPSMDAVWDTFEILEGSARGANRLLTVVNASGPSTLAQFTPKDDPLQEPLNQLFSYVNPLAAGDVEKAIDLIDKL